MRSCVMYTDGGWASHKGKSNHAILSWGIVALHDDTHVELTGTKSVHIRNVGPTNHEIVAFIEAMLYGLSHGFTHENISYYTDDEFISYCPFRLHSGNIVPYIQRETIKCRLNDICLQWYDIQTYYYLLEAFDKSRITKVKGHATTVNNLRADYLSSWARSKAVQSGKKFLEYDDWLNSNYTIQYWRRWIAPFTNPGYTLPETEEEWFALAAAQNAVDPLP